jgi:hypothetical protein
METACFLDIWHRQEAGTDLSPNTIPLHAYHTPPDPGSRAAQYFLGGVDKTTLESK